jgi:hypothetical protein
MCLRIREAHLAIDGCACDAHAVRRALGLLPFLLTACVDTSPDRVKLVANVANVQLTVAQSSLATSLSGTFDVNLDLGDLAQQEATVSDAPTFQLVTATERSTLVILDALVQGTTFPVTVKPGTHATLSYALNDQATLAADDIGKICAGQVEIAGTLRDTSNGDRPLSFDSDAVNVSGCP